MKILKYTICSLAAFFIYSCGARQAVSSSQIDYTFNEINFRLNDTISKNLMQKLKNETVFKEGEYFNYLSFINERIRISELIKKRGNPDFSGEQIEFEVDTAGLPGKKFKVLAIINN